MLTAAPETHHHNEETRKHTKDTQTPFTTHHKSRVLPTRLQNISRSKPESLSEIRFVCTDVLILFVVHSLAIVVPYLRTRCTFLSWCPSFVLHVTLCCVAQKIHKYITIIGKNRHVVIHCSFLLVFRCVCISSGFSPGLRCRWHTNSIVQDMGKGCDVPRCWCTAFFDVLDGFHQKNTRIIFENFTQTPIITTSRWCILG